MPQTTSPSVNLLFEEIDFFLSNQVFLSSHYYHPSQIPPSILQMHGHPTNTYEHQQPPNTNSTNNNNNNNNNK